MLVILFIEWFMKLAPNTSLESISDQVSQREQRSHWGKKPLAVFAKHVLESLTLHALWSAK